MSKPTVYTKGKVYEILENFAAGIRPLKSVKEIREFVDGFIPSYKPSGRGRRSSVNIDMSVLQNLVAEQATKITGNDAKYLAGMVASAWNVRSENGSTLLDAQRIRKMVESGKLTFPGSFVFAPRQKRTRKAARE